MKFNKEIPVYGDQKFRGKCPAEEAEQKTFLNQLRIHHPDLFSIVIHPKNEGKRTQTQVNFEKANGSIKTGAADMVIPCCPPLIIELKRQNHTKSHWQDGQQEYLIAAQSLGANVCVALGWQAAMDFIKNKRP